MIFRWIPAECSITAQYRLAGQWLSSDFRKSYVITTSTEDGKLARRTRRWSGSAIINERITQPQRAKFGIETVNDNLEKPAVSDPGFSHPIRGKRIRHWHHLMFNDPLT